jgi:hypothetical protein
MIMVSLLALAPLPVQAQDTMQGMDMSHHHAETAQAPPAEDDPKGTDQSPAAPRRPWLRMIWLPRGSGARAPWHRRMRR